MSLEDSLIKLGEQFDKRDWKYLDVSPGSLREKTYAWPGAPDEDIMICVHKGPRAHVDFHRQDFFFFDFAYRGDYGALSGRSDNLITVHENECYIAQPNAGYALRADDEEIVIIGVLIRKERFFRTFLPVLSSDMKLFRFFLAPETDEYAGDFIHLRFGDTRRVRALLEMMAEEYASPNDDTQEVLKPLALALLMLVAREYRRSSRAPGGERPADKIIRYIGERPETATLKSAAAHFSYNPNYISGLLRRETGRTFSEILLEQRMTRAKNLLDGTDLTVEEVARMLGYGSSSNFYKAFREYFGSPPRVYARKKKS